MAIHSTECVRPMGFPDVSQWDSLPARKVFPAGPGATVNHLEEVWIEQSPEWTRASGCSRYSDKDCPTELPPYAPMDLWPDGAWQKQLHRRRNNRTEMPAVPAVGPAER